MINAQWLLIVFFVCLWCLLFAFYRDFHLYSIDKCIFIFLYLFHKMSEATLFPTR